MKAQSSTKITLLSIFLISVITSVTLNSCQKEVVKPKVTTAAAKPGVATNPFIASSQVFDMVSGLVFNPSANQKGLAPNLYATDSSGCATITIDTTTKPYTVTYNYGSACVGSDGKKRSGVVVVSYDAQDIRVVNNVYTLSLQNFGVNGVIINGGVTFTNIGTNSNGNLVITQIGSYVYSSANNSINNTTTQTDTINVNYSYEWVSGESSNPLANLQFYITGSCTGSSSTGQTASTTITSTLTKNAKTPGCNYYIAGTVSTVVPDSSKTETINYSTPGGCTGQMTVTENGVTSIQNQ